MGKKSDTKTKLLTTALDLIWASSYSSVSVDEICAKAGVQKGSFYHFFESKADLAIAALEASWEELRRLLDQIFSPHVPPLERLWGYTNFTMNAQKEEQKRFGYVVGCPYTSLACEQCGGDCGLRERANDILQRVNTYITIALRDACERGELQLADYKAKSVELFNYDLGAHAQARVANSLKPMESVRGAWITLLGLDSDKLKRAA